MRTSIFLAAFTISTIAFTRVKSQIKLSAPIWEANQSLPIPESVLYRGDTKELYVSLIDGAGNVKDSKGGVAILNLDGSMKNPEWVTGLNAPKGLAIYKNTLYIADITAVISVDIRTGKIISKLEIDGAVFLNDVTVDDKGTLYISDTRTNKIYQVKNNSYSLYLENVSSANGLKCINKHLFVLAGTELWKINAKKKITVVAKGFEKVGDGLEPIGNGEFIATCWAGIIYHVKADGTIYKLQDVQGKMNTADLGYNPKDRIIYIPTFNQNSVIAYQLK
ncbi:ATP-binding protein [Pedobacter sp. SL55]|uniref:ATP-binding protein n=1 Tax=Pedobacter sp. SL55 TaxID=2995161 RepID=UPI0022712D6D|nr:ATP-binding protein [Pedobacter sp. SL55]WAC40183.1 ATP-binding protein [Pedobacter sp. SL55]